MVKASSKGLSISKKLSLIRLSFKEGNVFKRNSTFSSSSSTALKSIFFIFTKCLVSAPPPGPTSNSFLNGLSIRASIICRITFSSFKKCWPSDFFRLCIVRKLYHLFLPFSKSLPCIMSK